jgi:hypothetical protein
MSKIKEMSLEREENETRAVTVAETRLPAASADGWDEVPETGGSLIVGFKVKFDFNNRCWLIDDAKIAPEAEGDTYAVFGVKAVWTKWGEDRKPQHRVTQPGQRHPERNDLPDNDEGEWPLGLDGKNPEDPWKDTRYVLMINTQTAAEFTFVTDTYGGRRAVSDLKQQIANARRVHPGAVPIVKLSIATMPTKFGPKPRPMLKVVDWHGGAELVPADEPQARRYSPDRITTHPKRMDAANDEPPPVADFPDDHGDPDDEIPF